MLERIDGTPTVAILGGNPVIGKVLQFLLETTDYRARFFPEQLAESAELPGGVRVALVMPPLSARRSEALMTRFSSASETGDLAIIELLTTPNGQHNGNRIYVSWPCSVEELKQSIEAALLSGSKTAG